jgi:hypothetical protein
MPSVTVRMVCCNRVATPVLWWYERNMSYTFACPYCGTLQTAAGQARMVPVGTPEWDALARVQGLV